MKHPAWIALALLLAATPAAADQDDPRLDELFQKLKQAETQDRAKSIESRIWRIWFQVDDAQARAAMNAGVKALAKGKHERAVDHFTDAIQAKPGFAEAWNRRATTYYLMGRYPACLADVAKVLELAPRHFGALAGRGLCLKQLRRHRDALEAFRKALKVNPHMKQIQLEVIRLEHDLEREI